MNTHDVQTFHKLFLAGITLMIFSVIFMLGSSVHASAILSDTSPNPSDMFADSTQGGVSHLLKHETVAQVTELKLAAYYNPRFIDTFANGEGRGGDMQIKIRYGVDGKKCLILLGQIEHPDQQYVRVTVGNPSSNSPDRKVVYRVPLNRVCKDLEDPGPGRDNKPYGTTGAGTNQFYANYPLPKNIGQFDENIGMFKVPVTIEYGYRSGCPITDRDPNSKDPRKDCSPSPSDTNSMNFIVIATGPSGNTGGIPNTILAPLQNTNAQGYGLRSAFFLSGTRKDVRMSLKFGIPCQLDVPGGIKPRILLYDADVGVFGPTYMWMSENDVALPQERYSGFTSRHDDRDVKWRDSIPGIGERGWQILEDASGTDVGYDVKGLRSGRKYKFIIYNPASDIRLHNGDYKYRSPGANVFSGRIPYDAIYAIVPCEYGLEPNDPAHDQIYSRNSDISVTSSISLIGASIPIGTHKWETYVARYTSPKNRTVSISPKDRKDNIEPCSLISATNRTVCEPIFSSIYPVQGSRTDLYDTSIGSGDYVCFFTRIKTPTEKGSDKNVWRYSNMVCSRPGEKPKMQLWGNDVRSGGKLNTSLSVFGGTTYGSWSEYGAFSTGQNINFATGSTLARGGSNDPASNSPLTFANAGLDPGSCTSGLGCYGRIDRPTSVINKLQALCAGNWFNGDTTTVSSWAEHGNIVCSRGTVTVSGNIRNPTGLSNLQQKIIIAKDIVINDNVRNIDAWLLALPSPDKLLDPWDAANPLNMAGRINTCRGATRQADGLTGLLTSGDNNLKTGRCARQLTINGPVIADKLYLTRTYGGDKDRAAEAAEIINLRADAFVWAFNGTSGRSNPIAQTISVRELPPRF